MPPRMNMKQKVDIIMTNYDAMMKDDRMTAKESPLYYMKEILKYELVDFFGESPELMLMAWAFTSHEFKFVSDTGQGLHRGQAQVLLAWLWAAGDLYRGIGPEHPNREAAVEAGIRRALRR